MYRLSCQITIGKFAFDFVTQAEVDSSWKNLTDTATITLPRKLKWKDRPLRDEIKRGDKVEIWLGWDFENRIEFQGYVSAVRGNVPVKIECEDEMWKLKQTEVTKAWRSVTLKQLLTDILPSGTSFEAVDAELGPFRISRVSVAKVLESLRTQYGLYAYFRGGVLYVGFPYSLTDSQTVAYGFRRNIISDDLVYHREDDTAIQVQAISIMPDGSQLEEKVGDPGGELYTLHYFGLPVSQLKTLAEEDMKRLRYTGYRGGFETFGVPFARHGDIAAIKDAEYPERDGRYFIDRLRTSFGLEGSRREVGLGRMA